LFTTVFKDAHAASFLFSDFDETLVQCRDGGHFRTHVRLFMVEWRNNTLLDQPTTPQEIIVTCADYDAMRRHLAFNKTQLGNEIARPFKLEEPITGNNGELITEVIPGFYYNEPHQSYYPFYYEHAAGTGNYLMEGYHAAKALAQKTGQSRWKGPVWEILRVWLSTAETARRVGVSTARAHSNAREWPELFRAWKADGELQHEPNYNLFFNISRPEFDRYNRDRSNITARKVGKWVEFATDLRRVALTAADERMHIDNPTQKGRYHLLVIAEDNQNTLKQAAVELARLVQSRRVPLKVVLINAGTEAEVRDTAMGGIPRYAVITSTGLIREATALEVFGEHSFLTEADAQKLMRQLPPQINANGVCEQKLMPASNPSSKKSSKPENR
jgi:hypothetical protein